MHMKVFLLKGKTRIQNPAHRGGMHYVVKAVDDVAHNGVAARWFADLEYLWRLPLSNHVLQNGQKHSNKK